MEAVGTTGRKPSYRLLHLEDSNVDFALIAATLERAGHSAEITHVEDRQGFEAAIAAKDRPGGRIDVILADYSLPAFDGMSALTIAHEQAPFIPFIFVSGTLGEEIAIEALKRGATDYVVKQRLNRLPTVIDRALSEADARRHRREAELALQESEARYRALATDTSNIVWRIMPGAEVVHPIPSWETFTGQSFDRYRGRGWLEAVAPEHRIGLLAAQATEIAAKGAVTYRCRIRRHDGVWRWMVVRGTPIRSSTNEIKEWVGTCIDVTEAYDAELALGRMNEMLEQRVADRTAELSTLNLRLQSEIEERRRAEAALRQSEARYRTYFDNFPDALFVVNAAAGDRFTYSGINPAAERVFALATAEVAGRDPAELVPPETAAALIDGFARCVAEGQEQRLDDIAPFPPGERRYDSLIAPLPGADGRIDTILGVARDVTDRERLENQLRQAEKMKAIGQLTGGIAHDFNNLLMAVSGNLELLEGRIEDVNALRLVHSAMRAADRGASLTAQLLAFSRKQHLRAVPVELNALVDTVEDLLKRTIGATVEIRLILAPVPCPTFVDPHQIELAILNIAINARDAMNSKGTLTIETRSLPAGDPAIPEDMNGQATVAVILSDTGLGMSEEVRARAFEPFFTTKEVGKGTGLGLSMVYGLMRQSGGGVDLRSEAGQGTTVSLFLPRRESSKPAPAGESATVSVAGTRVLIVDDQAEVRRPSVESLRALGCVVTEAESGPAALALLDGGLACDLVIADFIMPGMSGAEMMRLAREIRPDLHVLYITGYIENDLNIEIGPSDPVIRKPFKLAALAAAIRDAVNGLANAK